MWTGADPATGTQSTDALKASRPAHTKGMNSRNFVLASGIITQGTEVYLIFKFYGSRPMDDVTRYPDVFPWLLYLPFILKDVFY